MSDMNRFITSCYVNYVNSLVKKVLNKAVRDNGKDGGTCGILNMRVTSIIQKRNKDRRENR